MKLYLITRSQFHQVMIQEGCSGNWYGRMVCLEFDGQGIPVYTLTSEARRPDNTPASSYVELISTILRDEFKLREYQVQSYLKLRP